MTGLYKEYEQFCQKAGRPLQEPVQIKRVEIYGNNESKQENVAQQQESTESIVNESTNAVKKSTKSLVLKSSKYSTESSTGSLSTNSDREISTSPPRRIGSGIVLQTISP